MPRATRDADDADAAVDGAGPGPHAYEPLVIDVLSETPESALALARAARATEHERARDVEARDDEARAAADDWARVPWTHDGIPVLLAEAEAFVAATRQSGDFDAPLDRFGFASLAYLARYVPTLIASEAPLRRAVRRALERHLRGGEVGLAVELGCSVGADLRTLADHAAHVIGVDVSLAGLRAAKAQLAGVPVPLLRRIEGRSFRSEDPIVLRPVEAGVTLVVGNAMDPPLVRGTVDVALAVNVLDTLPAPLEMVGQMDAMLAPGGLMILTSPFAWNEDVTPSEQALGGGTAAGWARLGTAAGLVELLEGRLPLLSHLRYDVLETSDVPWTLREHARAVTSYDVHVIVAKKRGPSLAA